MKWTFDKIKETISFNGLFIIWYPFGNNISLFSKKIFLPVSLEFGEAQETFIDTVYEVLGIMSRIIA